MVFHHAATILVETVGLISLCPPALALMHFRTLQTKVFWSRRNIHGRCVIKAHLHYFLLQAIEAHIPSYIFDQFRQNAN